MNAVITQDQTQYEIMEKVIAEGDLSKLTAQERIIYYNNTCKSLGLNPLTQPFAYIKLNGKLALYARKDATEQLRKINNISIIKLENKTIDGVYVVTVHARSSTGQEDISTGAVTIKGLQGEALANAFLKAETKAKRRVTLSICGLGFTDESEIDSIPNAQIIKSNPQTGELIEPPRQLEASVDYMALIESAKDMDTLKEVYVNAARKHKNNPKLLLELTEAKDKAKDRIDLEMDNTRLNNVEPVVENVA